MEFSNADKLATILTEWSKPAVSMIASSKLSQLQLFKSLESTLIGSGLVSQSYHIEQDIQPFMQTVAQSLVEPMLKQYLSALPDDSLPELACSIVETAMKQDSLSILDGLVTFNKSDWEELHRMLENNMPVEHKEKYDIII